MDELPTPIINQQSPPLIEKFRWDGGGRNRSGGRDSGGGGRDSGGGGRDKACLVSTTQRTSHHTTQHTSQNTTQHANQCPNQRNIQPNPPKNPSSKQVEKAIGQKRFQNQGKNTLSCLFERIDMVEQIGSGIGRIKDAIKHSKLPAPVFKTSGMFSVVFKRPDIAKWKIRDIDTLKERLGEKLGERLG